jgi:hypothetical protein
MTVVKDLLKGTMGWRISGKRKRAHRDVVINLTQRMVAQQAQQGKWFNSQGWFGLTRAGRAGGCKDLTSK